MNVGIMISQTRSTRKEDLTAFVNQFTALNSLKKEARFLNLVKEKKTFNTHAGRLPEWELHAGNTLESLIFHALMTLKHPKSYGDRTDAVH